MVISAMALKHGDILLCRLANTWELAASSFLPLLPVELWEQSQTERIKHTLRGSGLVFYTHQTIQTPHTMHILTTATNKTVPIVLILRMHL